ncbi:MAG: hypothetical protein ACK55I_00185, partial [bacterium]
CTGGLRHMQSALDLANKVQHSGCLNTIWSNTAGPCARPRHSDQKLSLAAASAKPTFPPSPKGRNRSQGRRPEADVPAVRRIADPPRGCSGGMQTKRLPIPTG